jgi:hypothetical protein
MEQVLDVYKLPYNEQYPVVCMDESPKQLAEARNGTVAGLPATTQDARIKLKRLYPTFDA